MIPSPDKLSNTVLHDHVSCELLITTFCNMGCVYCIAEDLPGVSMSIETGQRAIDMFIHLSEGATSVEIVFTGGEPFIEFATLKDLADYARQRAVEAGIDIYFVIKTNGTILNEAIIAFLKEHCIKLVLSVDGTAVNHDKYRKDSSGNGTHHIVLRNLQTILQNNIPCVASMTVHPSLHKAVVENVRYLHQLGAKQIDIGPAYGTVLWTESESLAFAQSIHDVARYMREEAIKGNDLEIGPLYQNTEHVGGVLYEHWGCGALSTNIAFMPNGEITGCSALAMLVPRHPDLVIGDVWNGLDDRATDHLRQLAQAGPQERPLCQKCETSINCRGGCLAINYSTTDSPFTPPEFYCNTISSIPNAWLTAWPKE